MHAEPKKISAYRGNGEVLTKTQESGLLAPLMDDATGIKIDLDSAHDWDYFDKYDRTKAEKDIVYPWTSPENGPDYAKEQYDNYLHGMDQLIAAIEKEKSDDEQTLKRCLGEGGSPTTRDRSGPT